MIPPDSIETLTFDRSCHTPGIPEQGGWVRPSPSNPLKPKQISIQVLSHECVMCLDKYKESRENLRDGVRALWFHYLINFAALG